MIKPDIILVWPLHLDYPLMRYNLDKYRDYFRSITITFSNHHMGIDYSNFIRANLPFANFIEYGGKAKDWRNGAINEALDVMPKDGYVLFLEQDFFWTKRFLDKVLQHPHLVLHFTEGKRIHPAFSLVKRILVDETSRDFSAYPDKDNKDHFGKFFDELLIGTHIDDLEVKRCEDYYHLNGLSQNYMNVKNDQPLYQPDDFLFYNYECINLPIDKSPNHPQFLQIELAIERKYGHPKEHPFLKKFFP